MREHTYQHYENGWIHLIIEGKEEGEYLMRCPHCTPSWFLYKPKFTTAEVCYNEGSDLCQKCCEPECELARGSSFTTKGEDEK